MMETDRKKEVINICLDLFIEKGLTATSTRDLSSALKLQNAGLYYYFESIFLKKKTIQNVSLKFNQLRILA